jgi:hypothetical protein
MMEEVFTDAYIRGKIYSRGFLANLEEIIEDDKEDLKAIGLKRNQPGGKISCEELMAVYNEAKKEADGFFGVENISDPIVRGKKIRLKDTIGLYFKGTAKSSPKIVIGTIQRNYVKPILIHEYTHHLSSEISKSADNEQILYEGLSLAVEYELAGQINKSKCTNATIAFVLKNSIGDLESIFAYIDNFLDHAPKKIPERIKKDCIYWSGYPMLRIAKKKFGPGILRDVLFRRPGQLMDAFEL